MFDLSIPTNTINYYMDSYFGFLKITYTHLFKVIYALSCAANIYCTVTVKYVFVRIKSYKQVSSVFDCKSDIFSLRQFYIFPVLQDILCSL